MKKSLAVIILIILATGTIIFISSCARVGSAMNGSGNIIDQDIKVADFTGVDINGPFNLEIIQSDMFQVIISTDDNLTNRVQIAREDEILKIGIKAPATFFPTSLSVKIGMPRLYSLTLSGEVKARLTGFKSTFNFGLNASGKSILEGHLEAGNSDFNISDGSQVNLNGSAIGLDLTGSGTCKLDLDNFAINSAKVHLKEGSEAILNINGRIDVSLADASKIYYVGNPIISNTSISGGSFMKHK